MKFRIAPGTRCWQDFRPLDWPRPGDDPNTEFDVETLVNTVEDPPFTHVCRADGYGRRDWLGEAGGYGSGAIYVRAGDSETFIPVEGTKK
jgi:hypothetical protein